MIGASVSLLVHVIAVRLSLDPRCPHSLRWASFPALASHFHLLSPGSYIQEDPEGTSQHPKLNAVDRTGLVGETGIFRVTLTTMCSSGWLGWFADLLMDVHISLSSEVLSSPHTPNSGTKHLAQAYWSNSNPGTKKQSTQPLIPLRSQCKPLRSNI